MTQKELNYIEDIYNHEVLTINVLENLLDRLEDDDYGDILNNHIKKHKEAIDSLNKLLEGEIEC